MIRSFANRKTERIFRRERSRIPSDIQRRALRKLLLLHAATDINQLRVPPGNRLDYWRPRRAALDTDQSPMADLLPLA